VQVIIAPIDTWFGMVRLLRARRRVC